MQTITGGCSFALFIYGIVVMCKFPMIWVEVVVMVLFLLSEFLIQFHVFACLILLALVPLLCLFCCVFVCCCKDGEKPVNLPQPISATLDDINNADGSPCPICFQSILLEEQVMVLPCSVKHIFHENCIRGWTNVKGNCPICRYDLTQ